MIVYAVTFGEAHEGGQIQKIFSTFSKAYEFIEKTFLIRNPTKWKKR